MLRRLLSFSTGRTQRAIILFSLLLLLTVGLSSQFNVVYAATFPVNSTLDPGDGTCDLAECTLREAITDANGISGADTIVFSIGGGGSSQTINLTAPLDPITESLTIDGASQTGGAACDAPPITLNGTGIVGAANGLTIIGGGSTISGLNISGFLSNGIDISGPTGNNTIQCNTIEFNQGNGVNVANNSANRITQNNISDNAGSYISLLGGANNNQNAPVLTLAEYDTTNVTITGSLASPLNATFDLEYFVCNGPPEAGQLLYTDTVTTNAGTGAINSSFAATLSSGTQIAVTATDPAGNTSEFSNCLTITEVPVYDSTPASNTATPINIGSAVANVDSITRSDTITISNIGAGDLNVSFTLVGGNAGDFTVDTPTSIVNAGTPLDVAVTCTPTSVASLTTTLTVTHDGSGTPSSPVTYPLVCTGTAGPVPDYESVPPPSPDPASVIDMGSSLVTVPKDVNILQVSNQGGAQLNLITLTVNGGNAADFTVLTGPTNLGLPVDIFVRCTPSAPGLRTTTLTIDTNDTTQPVGGFTYTLECTGDPGTPDYTSNPAVGNPINVGSTQIGTPITNATALEISNTAGTGALTVSNITLVGGNIGDFTLDTPTLPVIGIGGSETISITCNPLAVGLRTTTLRITHDAPTPTSPTDYTVNCTGLQPLTVTPATLPDGVVGTAYSQTISAAGGSGSYVSFVVIAGTEPPGLTLNGITGVFDGTPTTTTGSPFTFTVEVTDSLGNTGSLAYTIDITADPIVFTPATMPDGTVGTVYTTQTVTTTGGVPPITLTHSGNVPPGLTFDDATGTLSGTPTTVTGSPFTFTVTATDSDGTIANQPYTITINPAAALVIAPATMPDGTVGTAYTTQTVTTTGGVAPITLTHSGNVPPGLTFDDATGTLSGTPTTVTGSPFAFTVTATDSLGTVVNQPYTITINPAAALVIAPATIPDGTVGTVYTTQTVTTTGGVPPITLTHSGNVPPGLTFDDATGTLSGTPTTVTGSPFAFTVTATDSLGTVVNQPYTITINPAAALVIAPATMPDGTVGTVYTTQTVTTTGGVPPITFTHSGNVPPGLTFDDATGTLSGTPTTVTGSPFAFTVTATDSLGTVVNQPYTITINPAAALVISPATMPDGTVGTVYTTQTVTTTGGVPPITLTHSGNVPPGLTFDDATGTLSGTPTTVTGSPFAFTVTATDSLGTVVNQPYTIAINPAAPIVIAPPPPLPNGTVGTAYNLTLTATGGVAPITFTHTLTLPPGLNFVDATGILSGTPTAAGAFSFDVTATDSVGTTITVTYPITIDPPLPLLISPASLPDGTIGAVYSQTVTASGGVAPITLTHAGNIPLGLTFNDATGVLSGTPTAPPASYTFTVTATDATLATTTRTYTVNITTAPTITVLPATLPTATRNLSYSQTISATGTTGTVPPFTFTVSVGTLPTGLSLSTAGTLSGTPTAAGTFNFTIRAQDTLGNFGVRAYTLLVGVGAYDSTPLPGNTITVGTVQIGTAISTILTTYNRGNAPIIIGIPSISSPTGQNVDFAVSTIIVPPSTQQFPYSLNGNASQQITIRCTPSAAGVRQALLTIPISGDPSRASAIYVLQCTGSGTAVITATPIGFVPTATAFVPTVTPVIPANGTVDGVKGLAMRTGPYLGATLIGKAIPGVPYPILAQSNDEGGGITWYLITVDKVTGWVSGLYLNVSGNLPVVPFQGSIFDQIDGAPDVGVTARAMSIIDIRRRPSGRAAILTQVPQDGIVRLLGRTRQNGGDFWVQINYNGVIGWIPAAPIDVIGTTANVPIR